MRVIKLLAMVVVLATLASCGIFKNTSKHKEKFKLEEIVKRDCVIMDKSTSKAEVKQQVVDHGIITTETETKIVTEKPAGKTKVVIKGGDLTHGNNYLKDSAGTLVNAILDTLSKTLTLEVTTPPERTESTKIERKTERKNLTDTKESKEETTQDKQVANAAQTERRQSSSTSDSESKPSGKGIIWGAIGLLLVVLVLLWYFGVKRKKS